MFKRTSIRALAVIAVATLAVLVVGNSVQAAPFAAKASVSPQIQYLNDTSGTLFTFTVHNIGTSASIGAVEIDRPASSWTVTACPQAPAGWTTQRADTKCRYRSATPTSDDIQPGQSSSQFQLTATTLPGSQNIVGTWGVIVSKSNGFDTPSKLTAASAEPPGLAITVHSFEVLNAIIDGTPSTAGSPCPTSTAANHSAITGSTGHTIVICGKNRMNIAATPNAANSSLAGTFIGSAGTFTSGAVAANSASSVVLGKWSNVTITSSAGSGKTIIAKIGSASNRTSPLTTLSGYTALNTPPTAQATSATTDEDTTSGAITLSASDPDGDATTFSIDTAPAHGSLSALSSPPSCSGTVPKTCSVTTTYTPSQDYNGADSFKYKANDGHADSAAATVSLTVNAIDDPTVVDTHTFSV